MMSREPDLTNTSEGELPCLCIANPCIPKLHFPNFECADLRSSYSSTFTTTSEGNLRPVSLSKVCSTKGLTASAEPTNWDISLNGLRKIFGSKTYVFVICCCMLDAQYSLPEEYF